MKFQFNFLTEYSKSYPAAAVKENQLQHMRTHGASRSPTKIFFSPHTVRRPAWSQKTTARKSLWIWIFNIYLDYSNARHPTYNIRSTYLMKIGLSILELLRLQRFFYRSLAFFRSLHENHNTQKSGSYMQIFLTD